MVSRSDLKGSESDERVPGSTPQRPASQASEGEAVQTGGKPLQETSSEPEERTPDRPASLKAEAGRTDEKLAQKISPKRQGRLLPPSTHMGYRLHRSSGFVFGYAGRGCLRPFLPHRRATEC